MLSEKSTNQQLIDYIKKNLAKGYTLDALRYSLVKQGYSRTSVDKSIDLANREMAAAAPKMVEKPVVKWEVIDDNEMAAKVAANNGKLGFWKRLFNGFKS